MGQTSLAALRDKILGHLYPVYGRGKTQEELAEKIPDVPVGDIARELTYLIEKKLVRPPFGYGEFVIVGGSTPMDPRYDITAEGIDYIEEKSKRETTEATKKPLARTEPSEEQAERWLQECSRFLENAENVVSSDHADSVAHSSKAIEFAAKSLLALAGYEPPQKHEVGIHLRPVVDSLGGDDGEVVRLARRHVARLGWLCDVVAPLQWVSEYGFAGKGASEVVNATDASTFLEYGAECRAIAAEVVKRARERSLIVG